jgi:hypothetical protein
MSFQLSNIQLDQCKNCQKRGFSKQGLVCSLTNEKEEYKGECPNFTFDQKVEEANERIYGLLRVNIWVGLMAILGGLIWLLLGLFILKDVFIYPFFMIISGVVIVVRRWPDLKKPKKKKQKEEILDDEII